MDLIELIREFGPFVALVAFYVWDSRKQRDKQDKKMDDQVHFAQETLTKLIIESSEVIKTNNLMMEEGTRVRTELSTIMKENIKELERHRDANNPNNAVSTPSVM